MLSMESDWEDLIKRIVEDNPEVFAGLIASTKGFPLATLLPPDINKNHMAAIVASFFALAELSNKEICHGEFTQICVEGSEGFIIVQQVGADALLAILTTEIVSLDSYL